jgi:hypothetical protein
MKDETKTEHYTFEMVWQMFAETDKKFAETSEQMQETDKKFAETRKLIEENQKEIAELRIATKEVNAAVSGIGKSNGLVAEEMIYNALEKDMTFAGVEFDDIRPNMGYKSKKLNLKAEFDIVLTNGTMLAIIETK